LILTLVTDFFYAWTQASFPRCKKLCNVTDRYMGISSVPSASHMPFLNLPQNMVLGISCYYFFFTSICNEAEDAGLQVYGASSARLIVSDVCSCRIAFKVQEALKEFFIYYKRILEHFEKRSWVP
jgi:hypothetical protein